LKATKDPQVTQRPRTPPEANVILAEQDRRQRAGAGVRDRALTILAAYLAVTLAPAIAAALRGAPAAIAIAHVVALIVVAWLVHSSGQPARVPVWRDWLPLSVVPFLYGELRYLIGGVGAPLHDAAVQQWESGLFGTSPAQTFAVAWPFRPVSEILHAGYLAYYLIIYAPPLVLYLRGRRETFRRVSAALIATFALCFALFVVFPVAGPRYLWPAGGVPHGVMRSLAVALLEAGSSPGTAFPSSHVAIAVVQTGLTLATQRRLGVITGVLTVLLATGAVYGGFHYAVDVIAGALVGGVAAVVAVPWIRSGSTNTREASATD
jgi:membrane-associated phospholipid phosphatase